MRISLLRTVAVGSAIGLMGIGCASPGQSHQEAIGEGIVRGTLGSHPDWEGRLLPPHASEISGQVVELEGGAYVIQENGDVQYRLPLDENTRIDRPAHVGDRIHAWMDDRGRALLIRNVDHE